MTSDEIEQDPTSPADAAPTAPVVRVDLDARRGGARWRAILACVIGVVILALAAASLVFVAVFAIARLWTWIRGRDLDQFWLWELAPAGALLVGLGVVAVSFTVTFWWMWSGAAERVLRDVQASPLEDGKATARFSNVVEELSIGLGRPVPELWTTEDPAPNALSLRSRERRVLCITSAVLDLPRHEQEAIAAHELAHLWSRDAHWVTAGSIALAVARRAGTEIAALGVVVVVATGWLAFKDYAYLWGTFVTGLGLLVVGGLSAFAFRGLELSVRRHADEIADVAAVQLARDPVSLAQLCIRLAESDERVGPAPSSAEHLWFELVEVVPEEPDSILALSARVRTRRDLLDRAERAYAEARVPMPSEVRQRVERWRRENASIG